MMSNSDTLTPVDLANRISHLLLLIALGIGAITFFSPMTSSSALVELFKGMNLRLPAITQLFISPFSKLIIPALVIALIAKEFVLEEQVVRRLYLNGIGLVLVLAVREFFTLGGFLPIFQLIGNLG